LYKFDNIAFCLASEAVKSTGFVVDFQRRFALAVERAAKHTVFVGTEVVIAQNRRDGEALFNVGDLHVLKNTKKD